MKPTRTVFVITTIWLIALIVALSLDTSVAAYVHNSGIASDVRHAKYWPRILKAPGDFRFNLTVVFLLVITRQIICKQGILVVLAGVLSGVNSVIKWVVGRYRPYHPDPAQLRPFHVEPFWHGWHGFLKQGPLAFPSGHACTSSALAAALFIIWPRGRWLFVVIALLTCSERILENAHYPSDVVGAIGLGVLCATLLNTLLKNWMTPKLIGFDPILTEKHSA